MWALGVCVAAIAWSIVLLRHPVPHVDYAKIEQLEEELGIGQAIEPPAPTLSKAHTPTLSKAHGYHRMHDPWEAYEHEREPSTVKIDAMARMALELQRDYNLKAQEAALFFRSPSLHVVGTQSATMEDDGKSEAAAS